MSGQCLFKTAQHIGDKCVKRVNLEPRVSVIQCGEKQNIEADNTKYNSRIMQNTDSSVSTRFNDYVAVLQ